MKEHNAVHNNEEKKWEAKTKTDLTKIAPAPNNIQYNIRHAQQQKSIYYNILINTITNRRNQTNDVEKRTTMLTSNGRKIQ